jgi:hypothetical protein
MKSYTQVFKPETDSVLDLPEVPGFVEVCGSDGATSELIVADLRAWMLRNRDDLTSSDTFERSSTRVRWWSAPPRELEAEIAARQSSQGGLRPGRPTRIRDRAALQEVENSWGLYRIFRDSDKSNYIGISSNLRNRLYTHSRSGMFKFESKDFVEVIYASSSQQSKIVTWQDLQRAETLHIERFKSRGAKVINVTAGGNGRPPGNRFNLTGDHLEMKGKQSSSRLEVGIWSLQDPDTEKEIEGSEFPRLDLGIKWVDPQGDWNIWLDEDGSVGGYLPGEGGYSSVSHEVPLIDNYLSRLYGRKTCGRKLRQDIAEFNDLTRSRNGRTEDQDSQFSNWKFPNPPVLKLYRPKRLAPVGSSKAAEMYWLGSATAKVITDGRMPAELSAQGFRFDDKWNSSNHHHINPVRKVLAPSGQQIYLKIEENRSAARAEELVSMIWFAVGWRGIDGRVLRMTGSNVLRIPAVGTDRVRDCGSFHTYFDFLPDESRQSLASPNAASIKRITLADMNLHDDLDAMRFLTINAITGNTDRHKMNIHIGKDVDVPVRNCYLLPIDHGLTVFNNQRRQADRIYGTPAETVCGRYGNPHQMLRPCAELSESRFEDSLDAVRSTARQVHDVLAGLALAPYWQREFLLEMEALAARCLWLLDETHFFLDSICEVIV